MDDENNYDETEEYEYEYEYEEEEEEVLSYRNCFHNYYAVLCSTLGLRPSHYVQSKYYNKEVMLILLLIKSGKCQLTALLYFVRDHINSLFSHY